MQPVFIKLLISNLSISYPWWLVLIVILTGLLYAGILYFRNKKLRLGQAWKTVLFVLRFIAVSSLVFLLLSPFIKTKKRQVEKPMVIFGIDNSQSLVLGADSSFNKNIFPARIKEIQESLSEKYSFETLLFGEEVVSSSEPTFSDQVSDYASIFTKSRDDFAGMNIGAIVIAGDGINNRGIDPEFAASGLMYPVYTIALGDTTIGREILINDVRFNSLAYADDLFPVEVNLKANKLDGRKATINVFAFGKQQESKNISINKTPFSQSFLFNIKAEQEGKHRIRINVETDGTENESHTRDIFIDVLKTRQKVLILANSPHPDLSAIKSSLDLNKNYETEIQYPGKLTGNIADYDLVILHQLPSIRQPAQKLITDLIEKNIPLLFILGKQSNLNLFNRHFSGVELRAANNQFEEAQVSINPSFSLFTFNEEFSSQLEKMPPLVVPFGTYRLEQNTGILGFQRISRFETELPLIMFHQTDGNRTGLISGEGLWLWRIHNYLQDDNYNAFDAIIGKSAQYLMARKDKRHFRVITDGKYNSNQKINVQAELYNPSYELVNEPDVNFRLTNESGDQFNYVFSPQDQAYTLDLDRLPIGVYSYTASTRLGTENFNDRGEFVVSSQLLESRKLDADHALLYRLANDHNGQMLYPEEISQLPELLANRDDLKSKIYYEEQFTGLINLWWVIGLILSLLSLEWFLRKYLGSY